MDYVVTIQKPTAQPGETTQVVGHVVGDVADLRLVIGRSAKAIDWRVRQVNDRVLEQTRKNLKRLGLKIPGF